jgi:hypothetical protein
MGHVFGLCRFMKMKLSQFLRWISICSSIGLMLWIVLPSALHMAKHFDGNWPGMIFPILFLLCIAAIPVAVAYSIFRHQYRPVCSVICGIGAAIIFSVLISIPRQFGLYQTTPYWLEQYPALGILGLPLSLFFLFAPFYLARWFHRRAFHFLEKHFGGVELHDGH